MSKPGETIFVVIRGHTNCGDFLQEAWNNKLISSINSVQNGENEIYTVLSVITELGIERIHNCAIKHNGRAYFFNEKPDFRNL